ncbi:MULTISPECIES: hypothetical protein [unclassified Novosphingobium]|uniref:hypothetical protein n=1 Tax=unclassified Novosphingobium TaxID=2644732 RepID=UPI0025D07E49|nr:MULTISPECIES: hypothetical protein [unclassified Novosphingobium]HQV02872.1 hypothetical protein [Novosphingobium sp.]
MKRRSLVITDETARHPFRAGLAPHIRLGTEPRATARRRPWFKLDDLRDFLMAYCACFLAVSLYIA